MNRPRLPAVRSQHKGVEAPPPAHTHAVIQSDSRSDSYSGVWRVLVPAQVVQDGHVGVHVVQIVRVRRVVVVTPARRRRTVQVKDVMLRFRLVVHAVEPHHLNNTFK